MCQSEGNHKVWGLLEDGPGSEDSSWDHFFTHNSNSFTAASGRGRASELIIAARPCPSFSLLSPFSVSLHSAAKATSPAETAASNLFSFRVSSRGAAALMVASALDTAAVVVTAAGAECMMAIGAVTVAVAAAI